MEWVTVFTAGTPLDALATYGPYLWFRRTSWCVADDVRHYVYTGHYGCQLAWRPVMSAVENHGQRCRPSIFMPLLSSSRTSSNLGRYSFLIPLSWPSMDSYHDSIAAKRYGYTQVSTKRARRSVTFYYGSNVVITRPNRQRISVIA